jgi:hypothetical protein
VPVHSRWLAATALSYAVLHHLGLLPDGLGAGPRGTRWTDWLDLAVPWLVIAPAAATIAAAEAGRRTWIVLAAGAVAYSSGHGIHLAANSISNVDPGPTAHLWDEAVGHLVWYAGVALVLAAIATTMRGRPRPEGRRAVAGVALAVAVGTTWATNAVGGVGTGLPALVLAILAAAWGWRHRHDLAAVVLVAGVAAAVVLLAALAVG